MIKRSENKIPHAMKNVSFILVGIYTLLTILPLYLVVINAFKKTDSIISSPFAISAEMFQINAFLKAMKSLDYFRTIINNIIFLVLSMVMVVLFSSLAAFAITYTRKKLLKSYYAMLVGIMTLPFIIAMVPLAIIMKKIGLLDSYLGTSLVYAAYTMPFAIFLYVGHMKSIPKELMEAATIDGCGVLQIYWRIFIPLLKAATSTVVILQGVAVWNDYLIAFTTLSTPKYMPLSVRLYAFASQRFTSWDLLFASTLLSTLPVMLIFLFLQKYFIGGVTAGAIKG
jgi:raffinose/stachyose/melibiose transport system permease protein